jgi:hypothetical protein
VTTELTRCSIYRSISLERICTLKPPEAGTEHASYRGIRRAMELATHGTMAMRYVGKKFVDLELDSAA